MWIIETMLACDYCDTTLESGPSFSSRKTRVWADAREDGWKKNKDRHTCPYCIEEEDDE